MNIAMRIMKWLGRKYALAKGKTTLTLEGTGLAPRYWIDTTLELEKVRTGDGEKELIRLLVDEIRSRDVVFDIGANIGLFSLPAALKLQGSGRVIAFEPVASWAERLRANIALNGLDNVSIYEIGLYSDDRGADLYRKNILGSGMASVMTTYDKIDRCIPVDSVQVQLVKGDSFIGRQQLPTPSVIKMDVEGAEFEALSGLQETLSRPECRLVLCEVHPQFLNVPPERVESLLTAAGFCVETIGMRRSEHHLLARKMTT